MDQTLLTGRSAPLLLGVIPARGGSKGIKKKNLRNVLGRPLISYTIEEARSYRDLFRTIVTTDSAEIARVAVQYGAEVPFMRPKKLARDGTPMLDVLKHALQAGERLYASRIGGVVLLDPTSPLRDKADMEGMVRLFQDKEPDLVVAVAPCRKNPYFNMLKIGENGYARLVLKGDFARRQDAPPLYDIANNCWIFSRRAVLRGWRIPKRTLAFEIRGVYADVDREDDFEFLKWHLRTRERT